MNEYSISDYGIFSDAITSTKDCSNKITTAKDGVTACKNVISDQGTFMGPIADKCVSALASVDTDCSTIISNLSTMSSYLVNTSAAYQAGDQNANGTITAIGDLTGTGVGSSTNVQAALAGGVMYSYQYNGQTFNVANTKINVDTYAEYLQKNKIYQNAGFMGGDCMLLSQYYASEMLRG